MKQFIIIYKQGKNRIVKYTQQNNRNEIKTQHIANVHVKIAFMNTQNYEKYIKYRWFHQRKCINDEIKIK